MSNHRRSWFAFAVVVAMSLAGMLVAAQALAQHQPGERLAAPHAGRIPARLHRDRAAEALRGCAAAPVPARRGFGDLMERIAAHLGSPFDPITLIFAPIRRLLS
jgi:hypothetical protein